jgi:hypothetical protein
MAWSPICCKFVGRFSTSGVALVVQLNAWREELYRKGVLDRDAKSPREEFKRVRNSLQVRGLIGIRDDLAWKA